MDDPLHTWRATVSIDGQPDQHVEGADRDVVVEGALALVPDNERDFARETLAKWTSWLPNRIYPWVGGSVLVERIAA
jgi:hypothetical protein